MEVFPISPASARSLWFIAVICVLLAAVLASLAYVAYSSRHSRIEIDTGNIRLVGDFWGRTIPFEMLRVSEARVIDLAETPEYYPRRRTLGTGLPGYASGWFRLRGGAKALVYLTNRSRVVYIPTSADYVLLLSVEEPAQFIEALRRRAL